MKLTEYEIITELNSKLGEIQDGINVKTQGTSLPMTFVVGCPRSGTTALLQYLANIGTWTYPTNFLTRFSGSPYIGTLIQELLFNKNFGLIDQKSSIDFKSNYGRSLGALNANEFFHFFRRFFPTNEIKHLNKEQLALVDTQNLQREIASVCELTQKPFLSKGLMFQYNLEYFYQRLPHSIFVYIKRENEFVMQSIYNARIKESGDAKQWWSAMPAEYKVLKDKEPEEQIAGQVYFTNLAIETALEKIPLSNKLVVKYEDFVSNPEKVYRNLVNRYRTLGYVLQENVLQNEHVIVNGNYKTLSEEVLNKMSNYLAKFKLANSTAQY